MPDGEKTQQPETVVPAIEQKETAPAPSVTPEMLQESNAQTKEEGKKSAQATNVNLAKLEKVISSP